MSKVDEILAKQKELDEQLKLAIQEERDAVLADIKDKIKRFDVKATDFKGMFKSRVTQKQVEEFIPNPEFEKHTGELTTLDRFDFQAVDWIKIDVEGFENAVLEGSRNTIQRNRPWLLIEDNGQQEYHKQWLNDLCGPYQSAQVKSKSNTIWKPL